MIKSKSKLVKNILVLGIIIGAVVLIQKPETKTLTLLNGQKVSIEIAKSEYRKGRGLMFRKTLGENSGMLFVYETPAKYIFWMKNTLIPLDMIWIDENLKIVDISKNIQPCKTEKCQTYMPKERASYILEVNAGYADRQNIKIGDTLKLE